MYIQAIPVLKDNYIWTIIDELSTENTREVQGIEQHAKKEAIIVDPGSANEVLQFLQQNNLNLSAILITHHHWDHTNGISVIKSHYPHVLVYASKIKVIEGANCLLSESDVVEIGKCKFQVLEIPGHTLAHIAYYNEEKGIVFTGDTLFAAGCGRLFEGTPQQMVASLQKIAHLPDNTLIYCGHEYTLNNLKFAQLVEPSNEALRARLQQVIALRENALPTLPCTLEIEKATNPFLRLMSDEIVANVEKFAQKKCSDATEVFKYLRAWKDRF